MNRKPIRSITSLLGGAAVLALPASPAVAAVETEPRPASQVKTQLDLLAGTAGTTGLSWGIDAASKSVVISVPKADNDADTKAFLKKARSISNNVRIKGVRAAPRMVLGPGDAIHTGGGRCSASAIGTTGSTEYVVTAGHCTNIGNSWTTGSGETIGTTAASSFPGNDYGTIQVTNSSLPTDNGQLSQVGEPPAGSQIQKAGSTTGVTSGTLVGYGRTVNYPQGTVTDMIETTACVQPGDSGGSLYQGSTAIGITSGGTAGGCSAGFQSFFQPLREALNSQGLSLK